MKTKIPKTEPVPMPKMDSIMEQIQAFHFDAVTRKVIWDHLCKCANQDNFKHNQKIEGVRTSKGSF